MRAPTTGYAPPLTGAYAIPYEGSVCGRVLRERAMASSSRWLHYERSADLGKYWARLSPVVRAG